ncbi:N-acetylglucosamine-6-sulfatase-like isoform X2 [Stegodyphus dumicola]|uniref:N-acetylglucosamine-6-sulfatase-like isoform X2 n=1 Tax=Stegodyphus dumicola TaxID=202533 RepID=UPI0015A9BF69|nr:N-acetylglucosamine-6-sulfatase-like isoform X2 [Stegodyphus dumicola]
MRNVNTSELMKPQIVLYCILFSIINELCFCQTPNFLIILTDDQDNELGGLIPMEQTRSVIGGEGAEIKNMFVTTPLCCPSRASLLTGKYAHNHGVVNNSVSGNCHSTQWQREHEPKTFATYFKRTGYTTYYAGKYLNQYGKKSVGGVKHVPRGWDHWMGLVGNSHYYDYSLSVNGREEKHGSNPQNDYLTDLIHHMHHLLLLLIIDMNFLMFLHPGHQILASIQKKGKHWLLRQPPKSLSEDVIESIDETFRNRWRTLLSVDEGVLSIFKVLRDTKLLDNTFIFFTSDNGFHLGQFSLPWDKRQPYEFDVKVPLLIRGPGVEKGITIQQPMLNIDLAPTFLELANISIPEDLDGKSFATLLLNPNSDVKLRSSFIIEHQGEASDKLIPGCPQYKAEEVHTCEIDCICEDSRNNTYVCVRELTQEKNYLTCLFKDDEDFIEAYNLTEDPFQMRNIYPHAKERDVIRKFLNN